MRKIIILLILSFVIIIMVPHLSKAGSSDPELIIQNGHSAQIRTLAYSPGGKYIISGSADNRIIIWNSETGYLIRSFLSHKNYVDSVAFYPDGKSFVSGSMDGTIKIWSIESDIPVKTVKTGYGTTRKVLVSPDGKFIACGSKNIILIDSESGKIIKKLQNSSISNLIVGAFSPEGEKIITYSRDNSIGIWDAEKGTLINKIKGHSKTISAVSFSPDGKYFASGSWDGTIKIWDARGGSLVRNINSDKVFSLSFSPDGKHLVAGVSRRSMYSLKIFNSKTGNLVRKLEDNAGNLVLSAAYSPDGMYIAAGDSNDAIKIWEAKTGLLARTMKGHSSRIRSVLYSPDGKYLAHTSFDRVKIWNRRTANLELILKGHENFSIQGLAYSRDGRFIATCGADKKSKIWDSRTGRLIREFKHKEIVSSISLSPDGKSIACGLWNGSVDIWDKSSGRIVRSFKAYPGSFAGITYSHDGKYLATATTYDAVKIWNSRTGRLVRTLKTKYMATWKTRKLPGGSISRSIIYPKGSKGLMTGAECIEFSPDGRFLVSGSGDKTVKVWETNTGNLVNVIRGHSERVNSISYSPDGKYIASGSMDKTIKIWDSSSGDIERTLSGHTNWIKSIDFSPDSKHIVSGSEDTSVKIWNTDSTKAICTLSSYIKSDEWIVFTDDGYFDCSRNGGKYAGIRMGMKLFALDQFAIHNNRPDIILKRLGLVDGEIIKYYYHQYLRRLKKIGFTEDKLKEFHVPGAKIIKATQKGKKVEIKFELNDDEYDLKKYNIYINNVPLYGAQGIDLDDDSVTLVKTVELMSGKNKIEVTCINEQGAESYRALSFKEYNLPIKGDLYFIGFGISRYKAKSLNLMYADKDVKDLTRVFNKMKKSSEFRSVKIKNYLNDDVTPDAINKAKDFLKSAKTDDTVVLFIAGHGLHDYDAAATYYYLTYNADINNLSGTCINFDQIESILQAIKPRKKLFLMDTCESGEVDDNMERNYSASASRMGIKSRSVRGLKISRKSGNKPKRKFLYQKDRYIYNDLSRRSGAIVFSSSKGGEFSYEGGSVKNGFFTAEIMNCFSKSGKKIIGTDFLRKFVSDAVSKRSKGMQNPTVDRDNLYIKFGFPRSK